MDQKTVPMITFATDDEYAKVTSFADKCFKKDENCGYFKSYYPKLYREHNFCGKVHYTIRENDQITALAGSFGNTLRVLDDTLTYTGVGTVCVDEACRGRGYMQVLLNSIVDDAKKDGLDFVFLGGRRQRYELFKITPCGVAANYIFNKDNSRHLYGKGCDFGFKFKTVSENDCDILDLIYDLYMAKQCRAERERANLYDTLCSSFNHIEAVFKDDVFKGYILVDETHRIIVEAEFCDISDMGEILNDYLNIYEIFSVELLYVFPFETQKNLFLSRHAEGVGIRNCISIRVLNFKKLIKSLLTLKASYSAISDGTLSIEITGETAFTICVKDGKVSVSDIVGKPDVSMSLIDAQNIIFGAWKFASDRDAKLPACANNWFPLPFFLNRPDFV